MYRFKRHAAQQPLEAQLVGLRQREEEVAQAVPEDTAISTEVFNIAINFTLSLETKSKVKI